MDVRREPFHILFPLAGLLGATAILPWLLFGRGLSDTWPGGFHALVMTQGVIVALAAGFLGTMVPRRAGGRSLHALELAGVAIGLVGFVLALAIGRAALAQVFYLGVLGLLGRFGVRALVGRRESPSLVLVPFALVIGLAGGALLLSGSPRLTAIGLAAVQQGVPLALVFAVAPILTPLIAHGHHPKEARARRIPYAAAGVALVASFALDDAWPRAALLVRGALAALVLLGGGLFLPTSRRGLHRAAYRVALLLTTLGLFAAALSPLHRAALLHVTYIGGFWLLGVAVSVHVAMAHGGAPGELDRSHVRVGLAALLTLAAVAARVSADRYPTRYLELLMVAALLWLAAATAWAAFLVPRLRNHA